MTQTLLETSVTEILQDLFVAPRAAVRKWAERTSQTTQAKTAYPGSTDVVGRFRPRCNEE